MAETLLNQQEQKPDQVLDAQKQGAALKRVIGLILCAVMIAITAYVFNLQSQNYNTLVNTNELFAASSTHQAANYRSYVKQYKDTKQQLEETIIKLDAVKKQLDEVTAELATTKGLLGDTQGMLQQAQAENARLKQEIQDLEGIKSSEGIRTLPDLEAKIRNLREKNMQVTAELGSMRAEMRAFEAEFSNLDEGKSLVTLLRDKIRLVKSRMRYLKQEAYFAKVAAQKEKDRIATLNGNSGFIVRDGQIIKTNNAKSFAIDVKMIQ